MINEKALKLAGVTETEFKKWCKENKKKAYLASTKAEFFAKIADGRLVRDSEGKLVKKYKRKGE